MKKSTTIKIFIIAAISAICASTAKAYYDMYDQYGNYIGVYYDPYNMSDLYQGDVYWYGDLIHQVPPDKSLH